MSDVTITGSDMICFICQDFFCRPYTVACGHSFCHLCIEEYFLFVEVALLAFSTVPPAARASGVRP
jgi:hypothetical protein